MKNWTWVILTIILIAVAIALNQWAYDGDIKCLVAECRKLK